MGTNNELDYYLIGQENNSSYPHLDDENGSPEYYYQKEAIEKPKKMKFKLGYPIPRNPKMVDFHETPYSVISKKIQTVIIGLNLKDVQLLPVVIKGKNDELYKDYALIHIYNRIVAMDKGRSSFTWDNFLKVANPINKLVLKESVLEKIPLEDRLVFRLAENSTFELYHKLVVDAIMATNPEGLRFTNVNDWNIRTAFR